MDFPINLVQCQYLRLLDLFCFCHYPLRNFKRMAAFMSLAPELRSRIYKILFQYEEHDVSTITYKANDGSDIDKSGIFGTSRSGQLLRTSKTIRNEALPVLMDQTLFWCVGWLDLRAVEADPASLRRTFKNIQHIRLSCDSADFDTFDERMTAIARLSPNLRTLELFQNSLEWSCEAIAQDSRIAYIKPYKVCYKEIVGAAAAFLVASKFDRIIDESEEAYQPCDHQERSSTL